jgi:fluoride exporter
MYCQIIGCFIMGYAIKLKLHRFEQTESRIIKVLFTAITTGLCGSITSFSSWQLQCNHNFFLQWDLSWGNVGGSYNGGRFLEWLVCMWGGIVVPLSALHLGFYVSSTLHPPVPQPPERADRVDVITPPSSPSASSSFFSSWRTFLPEILLLLTFCVTIILVIAIPAIYYPHWLFLSYSAGTVSLLSLFFSSLLFYPYPYESVPSVFGICGAYLRYRLSELNAISPTFPFGTFTANVLGTWIAAAIVTLSKFAIEYYNVRLQSVLYGLLTGFCGGLTTVSTLVKELDTLPSTEAYVYSFATHSLSQLGIILILNIYTYLSVPSSSVMPPPINMCDASADLCGIFLDMIDCPVEDRLNIGCGLGIFDYDEFTGVCACGQYKTNRIHSILVDSQIKANVTNSMAMVWPTDPSSCEQPTEVFDFCLTYENICSNLLDRIDCPHTLRRTLACDKE